MPLKHKGSATFKAKVKNEVMISEIVSPTISGGIENCFTMIQSPTVRTVLLAKLAETHVRMLEWEAGKENAFEEA